MKPVIIHAALLILTIPVFSGFATTNHVPEDQSTIREGISQSIPATEEWVARYDGPGDVGDLAYDLAVDGLGNVYVTGYSSIDSLDLDYATVKYDPSGTPLWVSMYNGPGNGWDIAYALAVDGEGNVYVTGESLGIGTEEDYATIKYDPNGNELWVARYNGPGDKSDVATSIALDGSGNVYVTGGSGYDYATIKYNPEGTELWVARYIDPGRSYAEALVVDGMDNVYVTGWSGNNFDYATVKYDSSGTQLWVAKYDGPGHRSDYAYSIAIDDSENAYVTGWSTGSDGQHDYATVKYDPYGTQLWVSRYTGPGTYSCANDIEVDGSGNVYVTGYSMGIGTNDDYATVKYSSSGTQLWVARYNGPDNYRDFANDLEVDGSGNVYVTGSSGRSGADSDYATIKYNPEGTELWVARYNGPDIDRSSDAAFDLELDSSGNVYVTGMSWGIDTGSDYATIKYNQCLDDDGDDYLDEICGGLDCDDADPDTHPGASELCDGKDNDCDVMISDDEIDDDGDGYVECEPWIGTDPSIVGGSDCDDSISTVNPSVDENCDNGVDDDCDGLVDQDDPDCFPEFILEMYASYASGIFSLDFTLGTPVPAIWATFAILTYPTLRVVPLWWIPVPVISPPIDITIAFPFPSVGRVGIYTFLATVPGLQTSDLGLVDTGM